MKEYTLYREGNFYKGQLHTHTTVSDGEITPEDAKKLYKSEGYSFLAITDHNKYGIYEDFNEDGFIIIPGAELDCIPEGKVNHIVAIGDPETTKFKHGEQLDWWTYSKFQAQELVNYITESNNMAIYAHPYWSYADVEEIAGLKNILGVEIFNYSCEQCVQMGKGDIYYENMCHRKEKLWCFASDDAHGHTPDYCGGYLVVKAKELTHKSILQALRDGSFYACAINYGKKAPEIIDFYVEDGYAKLWCSPAKSIYFKCERRVTSRLHADNEPLTYHSWQIPEGQKFVRAVVVDENGNTSYTQPIILD